MHGPNLATRPAGLLRRFARTRVGTSSYARAGPTRLTEPASIRCAARSHTGSFGRLRPTRSSTFHAATARSQWTVSSGSSLWTSAGVVALSARRPGEAAPFRWHTVSSDRMRAFRPALRRQATRETGGSTRAGHSRRLRGRRHTALPREARRRARFRAVPALRSGRRGRRRTARRAATAVARGGATARRTWTGERRRSHTAP